MAGNTTPSGTYFVALDEDFFNRCRSLTIRYGSSKQDSSHEMTFTKNDFEFSEITYNGITYSGWICEFDNPWGSGAMQAHLYSLVLAGKSSVAAIPVL